MGKIAFKIDFPNEPNGFIPRLQNFAEDLHLKLARPGFVSVRDIDSITECAEVEVNAKRFLGEVSDRVHMTLVRHNFTHASVHKV